MIRVPVTINNTVYDLQVANPSVRLKAPNAAAMNAYQLAKALDPGIGTLEEWLASLVGPEGEQGIPGLNGLNGLSAYEVAVANGFIGDEGAWLASLTGDPGINGLSAYEVAVANGFIGNEVAWLASLVGLTAYDVAVNNGFVGDEADWLASLVGEQGIPGLNGLNGLSAYEVAVSNGFVGDEAAWLASLVGPQGNDGPSAYDLAGGDPVHGSLSAWLASLVGPPGVPGDSAYALAGGDPQWGDVNAWLASLVGPQGDPGTSVAVDPVRTTFTANGTDTDWGPVGGADNITNPAALIVAIDGVLQEPGVDYSVGSNTLVFTTAPPSGSKIVVISPTNTYQVAIGTPSDGTVTSSKLANALVLPGKIEAPNQILENDGSLMTRGLSDTRYGNFKFAQLSADVSQNNHTVNLATGLSLLLEAGTWLLEAYIYSSTLSNTGGIQVQMMGMNAGDKVMGTSFNSTSINSSPIQRWLTGTGLTTILAILADGGSGSANKNAYGYTSSVVVVASTNTYTVTVRQRSATDASNPAIVAANSWFKATRLL